MKVLREDLAEDQVFIRRFKREAQTLAKLQHPNIMRFFGLEQESHLAFLLMEYIDGVTLRRAVFDYKKPFSKKRVIEIMGPVCAALQYAHQQGLVHCDVKSANIMIERSGKVVLTDFGIARYTETATATMVGAGAPAYMAPEQNHGQEPNPANGHLCAGVVLFEMLSSRMRPFLGESAETTGSTAQKITWEHLHLPAPALRHFNPRLSAGVEVLVLRCLEKEPAQRYGSVMELLGQLRQLTGAPGMLTTAARHSARKVSQPAQVLAAAKPQRKTKTLRPAVLGLAGAVALAVGAFLLFFNLPPPVTIETPTPAVGQVAKIAPTAWPTSTPMLTLAPTPTLGIGSTIISPKDGMTMVYVPAGEFFMGGYR